MTKDSKAEVIQENHYYPLGMTMGGLNYSVGLENRYLYQGKETTGDFNLWWGDFHARRFDSQLGRWHAPDPAGQFASAYVGMGNIPVSLTDPNGTWAVGGRFAELLMLRQAEKVVADFRKQLMESFSYEEMMRDFQQRKLWKEFTNDPFGWGEAESRHVEIPERLPFVGPSINGQNDYKNQYNKEPKSIFEFVDRFDGMTYNEIILGEEKFLWIKYPNRLTDPRYGFVMDPLYPDYEIDMIHFLVVGTKGELMGFGNELKQTIQGIFGDENAWKSAFYEQDLYSNNLGVKFFNLYSDQIAINPNCLSWYILDFLFSKDRGYSLPNPPDFNIHK